MRILILIILILLLNFIPAIITLGVMIHQDPCEWEDDYALGIFVCYFGWPIAVTVHIGYLIMNNIGKLGLFVAGFLDSMSKSKEEQKMTSLEMQMEALEHPVIRIKGNELIKVKLTDYGKYIYYHRFDKFNKIAESYDEELRKPSYPEEDEDGYSVFQLWEFMGIYGSHIHMDRQNVIYPFEIVYEKGKS